MDEALARYAQRIPPWMTRAEILDLLIEVRRDERRAVLEALP